VASEALEVGAVGEVADCNTLVCRLDSKLWDMIEDKVVVAEPEVEEALPVGEQASLQGAEEEEEESSNQPADIEQGTARSEWEKPEAFLHLGG